MPGEPLPRTLTPRPGGRAAQPVMFILKQSVIVRIPLRATAVCWGIDLREVRPWATTLNPGARCELLCRRNWGGLGICSGRRWESAEQRRTQQAGKGEGPRGWPGQWNSTVSEDKGETDHLAALQTPCPSPVPKQWAVTMWDGTREMEARP